MSLGLIAPMLPFYARDFGGDGVQVGLLFTTFAIVNLPACVILGSLSDRYGRRPVLLLSLLGEVVAYLLMALASSLPVLFASRALAGATAGNIGAARAYLADVSRPTERTRAFGLLGAAFAVGFIAGPAIGGVLAEVDPRAPAFAATGLAAVTLVGAVMWLPESLMTHAPLDGGAAGQRNPFSSLLDLLRRPRLRAPLTATFLVGLAFSALQTNFPLFVNARFEYSPTEVAHLFVLLGVVAVLTQTAVIRRLTARFDDLPILIAGLMIMMIANLTTGSAPTGLVLGVAVALIGLGNSLIQAPLASLLSKRVGAAEQGVANGASQAMVSVAAIIGPIGAGTVYIYLYGPTFEPNGTRGCFTIDGTFTIRLESDGSTISGPLSGVFCSLSGRRTPQAYGNPFTEEDSINLGNGTGRFAALRGTAIFQQSAAGARNRGTLVGTLSD